LEGTCFLFFFIGHYFHQIEELKQSIKMSTLMSVDMNIERSSTRLHAPPGGKTSISFGDYNTADNYTTKPTRKTSPVKSSMSDLLSPRDDKKEEDEEEIVAKVIKPSNSSQMADVMNSENTAPRTAVRVRYAPGGASTLVLG
jgi:hypothetical protein